MMCITGARGTGIPTLLFHEGEGLTMSIETKNGTLYRGRAEMTEDNMNVSLRRATAYTPDGQTLTLDRAFIRGSQIVFVVFPEILQNAPYFERVRDIAAGQVKAVGLGRTRSAAIQAKIQKAAIAATGGAPTGMGRGEGGMGRGEGGMGRGGGMGGGSTSFPPPPPPSSSSFGVGGGGGGGMGMGVGRGTSGPPPPMGMGGQGFGGPPRPFVPPGMLPPNVMMMGRGVGGVGGGPPQQQFYPPRPPSTTFHPAGGYGGGGPPPSQRGGADATKPHWMQ